MSGAELSSDIHLVKQPAYNHNTPLPSIPPPDTLSSVFIPRPAGPSCDVYQGSSAFAHPQEERHREREKVFRQNIKHTEV